MPLTLTSAIDMGDADANDYTTVKITNLDILVESGRLYFNCAKGYLDGGNFVAGLLQPERFEVSGDAFTAMKAVAATTDESWWDHSARVLYQWLLDEEHFVGSIT